MSTYRILLLALLGALLIGCVGPGNDDASLRRAFESAKPGDTLVIPPGDYAVDGKVPIPLKSNLTVIAEGAIFRLPEHMGGQSACGGLPRRGYP